MHSPVRGRKRHGMAVNRILLPLLLWLLLLLLHKLLVKASKRGRIHWHGVGGRRLAASTHHPRGISLKPGRHLLLALLVGGNEERLCSVVLHGRRPALGLLLVGVHVHAARKHSSRGNKRVGWWCLLLLLLVLLLLVLLLMVMKVLLLLLRVQRLRRNGAAI